MRCFFFDYLKRTKQQFAIIFGEGDEEGDERTDGEKKVAEGMAKWGWLLFVEEMCGWDLTKMDYVLNMRAHDVYTHACIKKDKDNHDRQQLLHNLK